MIVPHERLSPEALSGVIEEYVTRDGTELGEAAAKVAAVRRALARGELVVVFDESSESCNILSREQVEAAELAFREAEAPDGTPDPRVD